MAKLTLKIDGKNKVFTKNQMTLGTMKLRGEFESKLENAYGLMSELHELYRKNRNILDKISKVESKLSDLEEGQDPTPIYEELDELEASDEYKSFESKVQELREANKNNPIEDFNMYDELATLLVEVFDHKFTYDEVMDGLVLEDGEQPPEVYAKIFKNDDMGKQKKKANTAKAKHPAKS
ncbi:phage tail assembly chaperone G [Staphylococcus agnetis]|uniref:phage tail assembly chaperone G n=1 Tax=Staphylococcus agnetis TaxID=985762 RepID=UPI00071F0F29|nr:hypothetical protein [Staphylococcus agnetis]ALN76068.1 hypothetical protein EP23_01200 [Staphylococcus agnetis]NJI12024.1 hypothetical protein [Staphylococcus agnetis]